MATRRRTVDMKDIRAARAAERPRLAKTAQRLHDVVDLASGKVDTTAFARAPTAASRVKRLSRLGFRVHPSIFGAPTHRLTPQMPYQAAPEAWLDAFDGTYGAGPAVDRIWWRLPRTFATEFMPGCNFSFRGLPAGPAVLSLVFEAWPHQGATGKVVVDIGAHRTEIAVAMPVERTVDIAFVHTGDDPLSTMVFFRPGIFDFVFRAVTLGGGGIVVVFDPIFA